MGRRLLRGLSAYSRVAGAPLRFFVRVPSPPLAIRFHRPIDWAGNIVSASRLQWFVDTVPPPMPMVLQGPEDITLQTTAAFTVSVEDDSPGLLGFRYTLVNSTGAAVGTEGAWVTPPTLMVVLFLCPSFVCTY